MITQAMTTRGKARAHRRQGAARPTAKRPIASGVKLREKLDARQVRWREARGHDAMAGTLLGAHLDRPYGRTGRLPTGLAPERYTSGTRNCNHQRSPSLPNSHIAW
jgi:hypothetical protein